MNEYLLGIQTKTDGFLYIILFFMSHLDYIQQKKNYVLYYFISGSLRGRKFIIFILYKSSSTFFSLNFYDDAK